MSKNISIKEGNVGKNFSGVKKIAIKNVGGNSTSYWVPEDETRLTTKHITKNGTYKASEEKDSQGHNAGFYGYSQVTVSGIGKSTYTAQAGDHLGGEDLEENEDYLFDENGHVLIPDSIGFQVYPPSILYEDGDTISMAGAVVVGYKKATQGGEKVRWAGDADHPDGIIPLSELSISPTIATYD